MSLVTHALEVQGHRGARAVLPENSLPAFNYALEIGVDTLELDTGVTRDGIIVVTHDQTINPSLCVTQNSDDVISSLWVHQLTLAQIKEFDCGRRTNPLFTKQTAIPGTPIPTLREVLEMVSQSPLPQAKTVRFNIEMKSQPKRPNAQPAPEVFAKKVLALIDEFNLNDRTTLQSFDHRTLVAASRLAPKVERSVLYHQNLSDWVGPTLAAKATVVSPKFSNITVEEVASIHAAGLRVIPWTANAETEWQRLIDMGVDGIITDDPEPLLKLLGRD